MAERKRQRKLSGYICCYFYNFICFISLYALVSSLFAFHFTFLMQKIKKLVAGAPDGGGPCHGTIGTMGNPALYILAKQASFDLKCSKMHWRLGLRSHRHTSQTNQPQLYHPCRSSMLNTRYFEMSQG